MTLRSRLALLFGLVALATSAAVGASSFRATSAELAASTDRFLLARADSISEGTRSSPDGRRGDRGNGNGAGLELPFDPDAIVQAVSREGEITGIGPVVLPVTDTAQRLVEARPGDGRRLDSYEDVEVDGESYRLYTRALSSGGAIQVARSTAEDDDVLGTLLTRFGLIAAAATIVASLLGLWIARRTTRPLRRLADVAAKVADTRDFSVDVPVTRTDEIGTLAASMRTMLAALEASRDQQQRLVQDASHELRTPLTSLRANVAMLDRVERSGAVISDGERAEMLAAISSEAAELSALFDELIDLASDTEDRDEPMVEVHLDDVVTSAVERWERRSERRIDLTIAGDPERLIVQGDAPMLERAITNLIGNAHKFSPLGEPIEVVVADGAVSVRDRGPGIPVGDRDRVFDRFHRSESTRSMPGSGLGLAIVAQIIARHGGEVWARESSSGGADVGFRLPTAQA